MVRRGEPWEPSREVIRCRTRWAWPWAPASVLAGLLAWVGSAVGASAEEAAAREVRPEAATPLRHWWPDPWSGREAITGQTGVVMAVVSPSEAHAPDPAFGENTGWLQLRPPLPEAGFSIALWVLHEGGYQGTILSQEWGARQWRVAVAAGEGEGVFCVTSGRQEKAEREEAFRLMVGAWHHLVVARRPEGTAVVWVDGERVVEGRVQHAWPSGAPWFCLGNDAKGDKPWAGRVREVRVYDGVLNDEEVRALHQAGLPLAATSHGAAFEMAREGRMSVMAVTNLRTGPLEVVDHRYTTEDGLPANYVQCVLQARSGHLWVGTENGLARFDGRRFRVFNEANTPALAGVGSDISSLAEAPNGTLWAGVYGGLLRVRGTEFVAFTNGLPERFVLQAKPASDGTVWVAGYRLDATYRGPAHVRRYDPTSQMTLSDVVVPGQVRALFPSLDGLWIGAEDPGGIYLWREGWDNPRLVAAVREGSPWIRVATRRLPGTAPVVRTGRRGEGLGPWIEFRPGAEGPGLGYLIIPGRYPVEVNRWAGPDSGDSWLGSPLGVTHIDALGSGTVQLPDGRMNPAVECLTGNREGGVWLGTDDDGLHLVRERLVGLFTAEEGLPSDDVRSVALGTDGTAWVATPLGLSRGGAGRWSAMGPPDRYRCLVPATSGVAIVAQQESIELIPATGGEGRGLPLLPGVLWAEPNTVRMTRDGSLWVAGNRGLTWVSSNVLQWYSKELRSGLPPGIPGVAPGWRRWETGRDLPSAIPLGIVEDRDGSIWSGSMGAGLFHLVSNRVDVLSRESGLPSDYCAAVLVDRRGALWVMTEGALVRRWEGRLAALRPEEGLPDDALGDLVEDDDGNLWFSGRRGIHRLLRHELDRYFDGALPRVTSVTFGSADGLRTPECSLSTYPAMAKGPDGRIWAATRGGLAVIDPREVEAARQPPRAFIESVTADRNLVDVPFDRLLGQQAESPVVLAPGSGRRLEIQYTAVSLTAADRLRFRHRLEGYDSDWSPESDLRVAFYTNLRPGDYRFRVQTANAFGLWSDEETDLPIRIRPHFWETVVFKILAGVAACGVLGWAHGRRLVGLRRLETLKRQEALASERARIAEDLHDELGATLTQIVLLGELARSRTPLDAPGRPMVERVVDAARAVTSRISDLFWSTNPTDATLDQLVAHLREEVTQACESAGIVLTVEVPVEVPVRVLPATFRRNVLLVAKEAVHNALRHGRPSTVELVIELTDEVLVLRIGDDGGGFEVPARLGMGHGLANMERRVRDLGGRWEVQSRPGHGTWVRCRLPFPLAAE